jgi:hypothetical protein
MANEKRLIDANAFQFAPDPWGGANGVLFLGRGGGKQIATTLLMLKKMVDNAPTVDAVEVVRCKDCKHYIKSMMLCMHGDGMDTPDKMDFCSYGERIDNV